ncbi:hypothetical protein TNCV_792141 [Trichonephila clavipes]|nr:hypothetical protein TNCV_792141 [Trichonephila clavipes]
MASEKQVGRIDVSAATSVEKQWKKVECTVAEGHVPNTNDRDVRRGQLRHQQRRFSTPLTSFQTSSAIKRNHSEVGLGSRRPLRRLPLTPHHRQCRLDLFADLYLDVLHDESRSLSDDDHRTRFPIRHLLSSGIQQFQTVWGAISYDHL